LHWYMNFQSTTCGSGSSDSSSATKKRRKGIAVLKTMDALATFFST
jgi:hypothetical protein